MSGIARSMVFGKLASRGDFLRAGKADEALRFLEGWLSASVEQSRGLQAAEPVRFSLVHAEEVLLGCWVPSRDEIGRQFPFVCFERVARDVAELGWSLLLGLHEAFLGEVEELLSRTCALPGALDELSAALAALVRPHPSELIRAASDARARLAANSVASFEQRVFGARDAMPYALLTLREAAARAGGDIVLDLPVRSAFDLFVWLELASCLADAGPRFPSLTWCPQQGRALVGSGAPSSWTMAFLVDRGHPSSSRWPVWTERGAGAQAREALPCAVREALAAQCSLAELLASLRAGKLTASPTAL